MPTTQPPVLTSRHALPLAVLASGGWQGRRTAVAMALGSLALLVPGVTLGVGNFVAQGSNAAPHGAPNSPADMRPIDINSASKALLKTLPGVDDATADRILAARPYPSKAKLVAAQVLTDTQFQSLKHRIVAVQPSTQRPAAAPAAPVARTRP